MRTIGATSTVGISMSDLKRVFGDEAVIPVSRAFAEANHFDVKMKVPKRTIVCVIEGGINKPI